MTREPKAGASNDSESGPSESLKSTAATMPKKSPDAIHYLTKGGTQKSIHPAKKNIPNVMRHLG